MVSGRPTGGKAAPKLALDFTSPYCVACQHMDKMFASLSEAFLNIHFVIVDVTLVPEVEFPDPPGRLRLLASGSSVLA